MSGNIHALSSTQRRMWFVDQLELGDTAYNTSVVVRVRGPLDLDAFRVALEAVHARHSALRTRFVTVGGDPAQEITDARPELTVIEAAGEAEAEVIAAEHSGAPFDLTVAPLARYTAIRIGAADHLLVFAVHHIVFDGWSADVFFRDLGRALTEGPDALDAPVGQQIDLVAWEEAMAASGEQDRLIGWWKEQLAGAPKVLDLVTDRPRPAVQAHRGARRQITVDGDTLDGLEALSRTAGATLFMTLLSALGVVLTRHAGQPEVLIGTPVVFRPRTDLEDAIGCFLNTVVMRVDAGGELTFLDMLRRTADMSLAAFDHQQAPFERLVTELAPEHDLRRNPLIQVMLNFASDPQPPSFPGCTTEQLPYADVPSKFDLTLYAQVIDGRLDLEMVYDADLFTETRADWLLQQLGTLLKQVSRNPYRRILEYGLLSRNVRHALPDPREPLAKVWLGSVPQRLAQHVRETPHRFAMSSPGGAWTYGELDRAANAVAVRLQESGVRRGDMVGIVATRDPSTQVAMLAAMKCAAPFVLMDYTLPPSRLAQCVAVSAPAALLLTRGAEEPADHVRTAGPQAAAVIRIDDETMAAPPGPEVDVEIRPDDPIYAVFTSGSTGLPKCVVAPHDAVTHFLGWYEQTYQLGPDDRFAALAGLGYEVLMRDLLTPMWVGARSVFPEHDRLDFAGIMRWLGDTGATVVHLTPPYASELAGALPAGRQLPEMRLVGINGDVLRRSTAKAWAALAPRTTLINIYGATETPQVISALSLRDAGSADGIHPFHAKAPIGPGIEGFQLLCVNPAQQLCAEGEIGELVVRTPYLARYLGGEPGGFTTSPWTGDPADRVYRTGDKVRNLGDGCFEFVGRVDHQIKLRGHRIEPGDVEGALITHPQVGQALVMVRVDRPGDRRLVAYVTPPAGTDRPSPAELRATVAVALPKHMVPSAFVVLPSFPLNVNGKVDRAALPEPSGEVEPGDGSRAPATATERGVAALWEEVLAVTGVGAEDNFFDLGGHSLLLTRLLTRIREEFGVRLSLRDVFRTPTVAGFAALIEAESTTPAEASGPARATGRHPLSAMQRRMWFVDQIQPGDASYNTSGVVRVRGLLDLDRLREALEAVHARHSALRTRFVTVEGEPMQEITDARPELTVIGVDGQAEAEAIAAEHTRRPFDLATAPLARYTVIRINDTHHLLVFAIHHIVFDEWSAAVFFSDLSAALTDGPRALDAPVAQLIDLVGWEQAMTGADVAWWLEQLAGAPTTLDLITDRPRPAVQAHRGARRHIVIDSDRLRALEGLSRSAGATLFTTLLTAFAVVLTRHAGQPEVLIGTPVAYRPRSDFEKAIGCFINTVVLRVDATGRPTFLDLLHRATDTALAAFDHQQAPFERLVTELAPGHDLSRNPLYQALFALQNVPTSPLSMPGVEAEALESTEPHAQCDLSLRFAADGNGLSGVLDYDADLFDQHTMDRLIGHVLAVLDAAVRDPGTPINLLMLDPREREDVLVRYNDTAPAAGAGRTLPELIAEQAAGTPDAPALRFGDEELTYAELDRRANGLALRLHEAGVGPDVLVGVHLYRSIELLIAILAVHKAGGAYLPLDPDHPAERLHRIVTAGHVPLVLTGPELSGRFAGAGCAELTVGTETAEAGPARFVRPDHLAYVIYTSGSTGEPKGVQITHGGIVNRLLWMQEAYRLTAGDRVLHKTPISFDVSLWELFWPLLTGATMVIAEPRRHRDPAYLAGLIARAGVTVCHFVPVMLGAFLDAPEAERLTSLRLIVCSGEELPADVARRALVTLGARVENLYGPTEASVDVTAWTFDEEQASARVPIGAPATDTRTYVLDTALQPVPVGVPGELYLGGVQLARGYHQRPGLTAERFVAAPYGPPGTRLYRTGDRVRWLPGGRLEFLGRLDHQVKIRGFRIEPGEVEQVLLRHAAVTQAVATVREDQLGDRRLVAYVVAAAGARGLSEGELRSFASATLPGYMVPSAVVILETLPVTHSGKIDLKALPAPERVAGAETRKPETDIERTLAELWAEVLGAGDVGLDDNFFELGGDSMHAITLTGRARLRDLRLSVEDVFRNPTVVAQAERCAQAERDQPGDAPAAAEQFSMLSEADRALLRGW